jgi:hypothetical protein
VALGPGNEGGGLGASPGGAGSGSRASMTGASSSAGWENAPAFKQLLQNEHKRIRGVCVCVCVHPSFQAADGKRAQVGSMCLCGLEDCISMW